MFIDYEIHSILMIFLFIVIDKWWICFFFFDSYLVKILILKLTDLDSADVGSLLTKVMVFI